MSHPRERATLAASMDGSVTPKSLHGAIGLCHMGRNATPTEEIQMMEQHEIFSPAEATGPPPLLADYVPDAGEVDPVSYTHLTLPTTPYV